MSERSDVLVVGGGVVGLCSALAMAERGHHVTLVDKGSLSVDLSVPDLRVYAINSASEALLRSLGVWQNLLQPRLSPYQRMYVRDGENGAHIDFDACSIARPTLGYIVEESVLRAALLGKMALEPRLHLVPHTAIDKVTHDADRVHAEAGGKIFEARLLMVADGRESSTRELLNIGSTTWPYHQDALICQVETEKSHEQTAAQVFRTHGTLAFLPLPDPHQRSIVWSSSHAHTEHLLALSDAALGAALTGMFGDVTGEVRVISARHRFPLYMRHTEAYSGIRWMLLGDCAHTIHPLAGLGLNVGLADLSTWLQLLDECPDLVWSARLGGRYQRHRKFAVWQTILVMEGLKALFANPLTAPLRGASLRACNHLQPLKRWFIEHAGGEGL